uniref:Uncharacterized protein n=1 Tax=Clytia hemisphaerica TaxID=252671 RepID=A0A7M5XBH9_9CNID
MEKTVENNLLQTLNIERLVEFDSHIGDVFQNVFYTLSNNTAMKIEKMGIVSHFLRSWKDTVGASSISKTLPSIITGSIVEGACLSRLYHPSHEQSLELEADIMYIVGVIDEQTANQCFQR